MSEKAERHLWYGFLSDTFYVGRARLYGSDKPNLMKAVGEKHEIPEADVVGAFKQWLLQRQGERVEFVDGVIQWIPSKGEDQ